MKTERPFAENVNTVCSEVELQDALQNDAILHAKILPLQPIIAQLEHHERHLIRVEGWPFPESRNLRANTVCQWDSSDRLYILGVPSKVYDCYLC